MEEEIEEKKEYIKKYHCNNCNVDFYSKSSNDLNKCAYCYSTNINEAELSQDKGIKIIPFSISRDEAIRKYKKKVKFNPLVPLIFKKKDTIENMKRIYLPAFLSDVNQNGTIEFIAGDKNGKVVDNKRYDVIHSVNFDYKDYLLSVSNNIDDDVFSSICEYNYNNLKDTKYSVEEDYFIASNISPEEVATKGREKIAKHSVGIVRNNVKHSLKKLKTDESIINFVNAKEVYVPVYLLNVKYKNNNYQYIMNGENGKDKINLVYGILDIIIFSTIVAGIIFLIAYLIAYFL